MSVTNQTTSAAGRTSNAATDAQQAAEFSVEKCCSQAQQLAQDHPVTTVMTVFAVGLGVGAVVGGMLANSSPSAQSISRAEDIGKRVLAAVGDMLPNSIKS